MKKEIALQVDNLTIRGQLYLPENINREYPCVILCHGVPSGVVDPGDGGYPLLANTICNEGFAVLTFSFRGTGVSEGNFDIVGWTHDLQSIIEFLWNNQDTGGGPIALVGFSAGAAVSIYIGSRDKRITGVIACASPADFRSISEAPDPQAVIKYFRKIGIIRDPEFPPSIDAWLENFRKISAIGCVADISPRPLLLIHARGDTVVPVNNAEKLYARAGEPKQLIILETDEHRLRRNPQAVSAIINWLKTNLVHKFN